MGSLGSPSGCGVDCAKVGCTLGSEVGIPVALGGGPALKGAEVVFVALGFVVDCSSSKSDSGAAVSLLVGKKLGLNSATGDDSSSTAELGSLLGAKSESAVVEPTLGFVLVLGSPLALSLEECVGILLVDGALVGMAVIMNDGILERAILGTADGFGEGILRVVSNVCSGRSSVLLVVEAGPSATLPSSSSDSTPCSATG